MSAHSPSLTRTSSLRGADRVLVLVGEYLVDAGRRHASRRLEQAARNAERAVREATVVQRRDAYQAAAVEHGRDNAAQISPLGLR